MAYLSAGMLIIPCIIPCIDPFCKITSSVQGICAMMSNIFSSKTNTDDVINKLKCLDIEASVRILDNFLKELHVSYQTETETIKNSIELLKECIVAIEFEVCKIHEKIIYNKNLYVLYLWRSYKFNKSIHALTILKTQLDNRCALFFNILKNANCLHVENIKNVNKIVKIEAMCIKI